jgi:glucose/arabinose dehydrogenase
MRLVRTLLVSAALLVGCSGNAQNSQADNVGGGASAGPPFTRTEVGDFEEPWAIAFLPDGRALVTEKQGALKLWGAGGAVVDVSGVPEVAYGGQGGMLDVAPAPDFAHSRLVYLSYAEPGEGGSGLALGRGRLVEENGAARLDGFEVLWRQLPKGEGGQFGAIIALAPDGQSLFLSSGERQRFTPAQDPDQATGKILHLTLDGRPAPGNPGAGRTGAGTVAVIDPPEDTAVAPDAPARQVTLSAPNRTPAETWSSGHRNPYGLAFAPDGRLWEHEMGPRGGDELNLIEPGKNYGWPIVSNGDNYDGVAIPDHPTRPDLQAPVLFWNPSISPSGLIIYTGTMFPAWRGDALMGAMSGKALIHIDIDGANARKADQWDMGLRVRDVAEAPDGSVFLLEDGGRRGEGRLFRLTPAAS